MKLNKITNKKNQLTPKISSRLLTDSIVAIIVVTAPLVFYGYLCFPDIKIWKTHFFVYNSNYYQSVRTFVWVFLQKFIFLYLMIIFYFRIKDWWKNAILSPIAMLLYQIIMMFNDEFKLKDEANIELFTVVFFVSIICFFILLLRKKLSTYSQALDLKAQIDLEIEKVQKELDA